MDIALQTANKLINKFVVWYVVSRVYQELLVVFLITRLRELDEDARGRSTIFDSLRENFLFVAIYAAKSEVIGLICSTVSTQRISHHSTARNV